LQATDDELVARVVGDLALATGQEIRPVETHVQRWGGALPQYAVSHLDRVARIRAAIGTVPGLVLCGAAYDGVGVPAVIGSARRAAASLLAAE
jgi:oxygen-dependent protoporphyrinogen oxidase